MKFRISSLLIIAFSLSSCASWFSASKMQGGQSDELGKNVRPATNKELELKLASLWAKVSELETDLSRQQERTRVLEKGLMLGILPEELMNDAERSLKRPPIKRERSGAKHKFVRDRNGMVAKAGDGVPPLPKKLKSDERKQSQAKKPQKSRSEIIVEAQKFFEAGQYGRAIAMYSMIDGGNDQSHRYWMAVSWFHLKEYDASHKEFMGFINSNPDSAWIPRAKFNLAKVEYQLGYRNKALKMLKAVIDNFPKEDAAQMARSTLKSWERSL